MHAEPQDADVCQVLYTMNAIVVGKICNQHSTQNTAETDGMLLVWQVFGHK